MSNDENSSLNINKAKNNLSSAGGAATTLAGKAFDQFAAPTNAAIALANGEDPAVPLKAGVVGLMDPFNVKKNSMERNARDKAAADIAAMRSTIISDGTIDNLTKQELLAGISSGGDVSTQYAAAKAGEGVYGVRRQNEQFIQLMSNTPGQKQLFLSNQQRTSAGKSLFTPMSTSSGPLLTGGKK